jgi:uncharacterized protein
MTDPMGETRHICVRSFRRNGQPVDTPVWFTVFGGVIYLRTVAASGKVKRIRNDGRVAVAPCTETGEPTGPFSAGMAGIVAADHPDLAAVDRRLDEKYGAERAAMTRLMQEQGQPLLYVVITPAG